VSAVVPVERPRAGKDYPRSVGEVHSWFRTDADCLDYLEWLRWPSGFVCPDCGHGGGWRLGDGRFMCAACGRRTSVTAGTIFDRTRTPLTVWFAACWLFASGKDGISALSIKPTLEISSYPTRQRGRSCIVCARFWFALVGSASPGAHSLPTQSSDRRRGASWPACGDERKRWRHRCSAVTGVRRTTQS